MDKHVNRSSYHVGMPCLVRHLDIVQPDIQKPVPRLHVWSAIRKPRRVIEGEDAKIEIRTGLQI